MTVFNDTIIYYTVCFSVTKELHLPGDLFCFLSHVLLHTHTQSTYHFKNKQYMQHAS